MLKKKHLAYLNIFALLMLAAGLYYSYWQGGVVHTLFAEDAKGFLSFFESKSLLYQNLFILILIIIEVIIGFIPGPLIYPLIGLLINPLWGSTLILAGNILGSIANFYQGKLWWDGFADKASKKKSRFIDKLEDGGAWTLFLLRLNPLTSFDFLPYIAGGTGMKFSKFLVANTLGLLPLIFLGTYLGESILYEYSWALKGLFILTFAWVVWEVVKQRKRL